MYELHNGSERLTDAIYRRKDDPAFLQELANLLNYHPEQLFQDIQALHDRLEEQ